MNRCPITYQLCGQKKYSEKGLKLLSPSLKKLNDFPFSSQEQRQEATFRMKRMSIQGIQPKLSAILNIRKSSFELVDIHGDFILKPQNNVYEQLPENEDVSMRMATMVGMECPLHGLLYSIDGSMTYFIKRFDRLAKNKKLAVEDFSQLAGLSRENKYNFTIEKAIKLIDEFCTFPIIEKEHFFRLILFSFLIGNEDMHLKNCSFITRNNKVEFSPAYDLLNSTIAMGGAEEEMALSLAGKKKNFKRRELIDYLAKERLELNEQIIKKTEGIFFKAFPLWKSIINSSFLDKKRKSDYLTLLTERFRRLAP